MYTLTEINTTIKSPTPITIRVKPNSTKLQKAQNSGVVLTTPQQREIISKNGSKALSNVFFGSRKFQSAHNKKNGAEKNFKVMYDELLTVSDSEEKKSGLKRLFAKTNESDLEDQSITLKNLIADQAQTDVARIALEAFLGIDSSNNLNLFIKQCEAIIVATQRKIMNKNDKEILTKFYTPSEDLEVLEEQNNFLQDLLIVSTQKSKSSSDLMEGLEEHPQKDVARIALEAFLGEDSSNNPNLFIKQCGVIPIATQCEIMNKDDKEILTKFFTPSEDLEVLEEQTNSLQDLLDESTPKIISFKDSRKEHPKTDVARIALEAFWRTEPINNLNLFKKQCEVAAIAAQHGIINKDDEKILPILFTPNDDPDVLEVQNNSIQDLLKVFFHDEIIPRIVLEAFLGEGPSNNLNLLKKQYEVIQIAAQHGRINEDDKEILTKFYTPSDKQDVLEVQNKSLINLVVNNGSKDVIGIALDAFWGKDSSNDLNLFKKQCEVTIIASQYIQNNNNKNNKKVPAFEQLKTQLLLEKLKKYDNIIHNRFTPTGESDLEEQSSILLNLLADPKQTKKTGIVFKALEAFFGTEPTTNLNLFKKQSEIIPVAFESGILDKDDKEEILTILFSPSSNEDVLNEQSRVLQNLLTDPNQTDVAKIALEAFWGKDSSNNLNLFKKRYNVLPTALKMAYNMKSEEIIRKCKAN